MGACSTKPSTRKIISKEKNEKPIITENQCGLRRLRKHSLSKWVDVVGNNELVLIKSFEGEKCPIEMSEMFENEDENEISIRIEKLNLTTEISENDEYNDPKLKNENQKISYLNDMGNKTSYCQVVFDY